MKRAAIQRYFESSSDNCESPPEPDKKRPKCTSISEETEVISGEVSSSCHQLDAASTTESTREGSDKTYISSLDTSAACTGEVSGATSPPTSSEASTPVAYMSNSRCDGGTELVCRRTRNRKRSVYRRDSESRSDISDNQPETEKKRIKAISRTEETQSRSKVVVTSCRQPCAASAVEVVEAGLPSTSSQVVLSAACIFDSSTDEDTEIVCFPAKERERRACSRDSSSSKDSSDSQPEPHEKRVLKRLYRYAESSVIDCLVQKPEANVVQIFNNGSRGYESEPEDRDDEYVTSDEEKDSSIQESTDYIIAQSGWVQKPDSNVVQIFNNGSRSYESEPEDRDDEYVTSDEEKDSSIQESTDYIIAQSGWNSDWDISQEIASSVDVSTSGHQPGVVSTIEEGISYNISYSVVDTAITTEETEERPEEVGISQSWTASIFQIVGATSASTSSEAVEPAVGISDKSSNRDSQKCPICLASFAAQEVGTPDSCDHLFCVRCLEEWSANSNTCPLDREQFNVILVRQHPDGEVTRRIFLRPRWHEIEYEDLLQPDLLFCVICFNSDVEDTTLFCFGCGLFYHLQCLRHLMHTIPEAEWFCPFCIAISLASEAY